MNTINIIIAYWIVSTIFSVVRMYFVWTSSKEWATKNPDAMHMLSHYWKAFVDWLSKMNKEDAFVLWSICIPLGILLIISPPIFFPFTLVGMIAPIPKNIKKRKKKKTDDLVKVDFKEVDKQYESDNEQPEIFIESNVKPNEN